jgi:hypothetical protein
MPLSPFGRPPLSSSVDGSTPSRCPPVRLGPISVPPRLRPCASIRQGQGAALLSACGLSLSLRAPSAEAEPLCLPASPSAEQVRRERDADAPTTELPPSAEAPSRASAVPSLSL